MDGTDITTIVTANIKWPNGLAIDYTGKSLSRNIIIDHRYKRSTDTRVIMAFPPWR